LTAARTSNRTRRRSCTPFQNKPSRGASSEGRTAGLSVWSHKGLFWRGLGIVTTQIQNFVFPAQGRILFGQVSYTSNWYSAFTYSRFCRTSLQVWGKIVMTKHPFVSNHSQNKIVLKCVNVWSRGLSFEIELSGGQNIVSIHIICRSKKAAIRPHPNLYGSPKYPHPVTLNSVLLTTLYLSLCLPNCLLFRKVATKIWNNFLRSRTRRPFPSHYIFFPLFINVIRAAVVQ
jgi:hypothetical protein